jgi:hypothetical protein
MSEKFTTQSTTSESFGDQVSLQPWSAENYADQLMDDLFSDLDNILEGTGKLPAEPMAPPEYISIQEVKVPEITMPPVVVQPQAPTQAPIPPIPPIPPANLAIAPPQQPPSPGIQPKKYSFGEILEKILWVVTALSLVGTLVLWLVHEKKLTWLSALNITPLYKSEKPELTPADLQFINYMMRSLNTIDSKGNSTTKPINNQTNLPAQSRVTLPSNNGNPPQVQTVVQPIYIPYPSNNNVPSSVRVIPAPPKPNNNPNNTKPSIKSTNKVSLIPPVLSFKPPAGPAPKVIESPYPRKLKIVRRNTENNQNVAEIPRPTRRRSENTQTNFIPFPPPPPTNGEIPILPQLSIPNPNGSSNSNTAFNPNIPPPPNTNNVAPTIPNIGPETKSTLVGVLESGNSSAALFDVNGITQRIRAGEGIGSSGWSLVSVANKEAVIRRNGEVKSVYVGQKF